jgi:hypothetical protein
MTDITQLAFGQLTAADQLIVQLLRPADLPAVERTLNPAGVRILWPVRPTIVPAREFPEIAALAVKVLAGASVELSRLAAMRRG